MLALDNLIFREREFVWMDCQLLLRESWKVLRERRLLISFKDNYGEKVTQSVSKKTSYVVVGQDLGESKLSKVHCNAQLTTGKGKKKHHEHQHISCTFFPKFLLQIRGMAYCEVTKETCHKFA